MLNPSRALVAAVVLVGVLSLALGLATDVGLSGWSLAALLGVYLAIAGFARSRRLR